MIYFHLLPLRGNSSVMIGMLAIEAEVRGAEASSEVEGIEGIIPVEEAEAPTGTMGGGIILSGPTVEISILTAGVVHRTA